MNLVDEKHIVLLERGENAGKVARLVEHRTRSDFETYAKFIGYDVAESGFSQSRRTVEQGVVERLATKPCSGNENAEVLDDFLLTGKVVEFHRSEGTLKVAVAFESLVPYVERIIHLS